MQWIEDSWTQITTSLQLTNAAAGRTSSFDNRKGTDEPLPEIYDPGVEAILAPGVWKQDPNEMKWAEIESKKRAAELITIKCSYR